MVQAYGEQVLLFLLKAAIEESELTLQLLFDEMIELKSLNTLPSLLLKVIEVI
jgi:hypothetical protein